jgi:hypothetical protein
MRESAVRPEMRRSSMLKRAVTVLLMALSLLIGTLPAQVTGTTVSVASSTAVVNKGMLRPAFRYLADSVGSRLTVPGAERLTLVGTMTATNGSQSPAQVILELPDHLRYQQSSPPHTVTYDGNTVRTDSAVPSSADYNLVETFVLDGVERFLQSQTEGRALTHIGSHVPLLDSHDPSRKAALCNMYQVTDQERFIVGVKTIQKTFCFDVKTGLLSSAFYTVPGTPVVHAETRWSGWNLAGKNEVPGQIERIENSKMVFSFAVQSGAVSSQQNDGIFLKP